jgi:prolyl oligopeptidase
MMQTQLAFAFAVLLPVLAQAADATDPYLWLEDVDGEEAIAWVKEQNSRAIAELEAVPAYQPIYDRALAILDSRDRIPNPVFHGSTVYNFWQDQEHPRGILRRTSLASFASAAPSWELLLDIDAMAAADGEQWVYKGSTCLAPEHRLCMVGIVARRLGCLGATRIRHPHKDLRR